MTTFRLAIVGAGPSCTYALERLAATAPHVLEPYALEVHIFEKTGAFGCGAVHDVTQPDSSLLNRIAGQVSFAADETVEGAGPLLGREMRPTLHAWAQSMFADTGDPVFDLKAESWPRRNVHGLALKQAFRSYVAMLAAASVPVFLHHAEVVDVQEREDGFVVLVGAPRELAFSVHHVLFVTGHSFNDRSRSETLHPILEFAQAASAAYIPYAYPLEQAIAPDTVAPGKIVGIDGMGLTAIDVILYLTEGRGGHFETDQESGRLVYRCGGREPAAIVPFGDAGLFGFARAFNAKQADPQRLEHKPVFLTERAIDLLRLAVGKEIQVSPVGLRRQLDFERDIQPVVLLEMASLFYRTLFGHSFGDHLDRLARPTYDAFLNGSGGDNTLAHNAALLLRPIEAAVDEAIASMDRHRIAGREDVNLDSDWSRAAALDRYAFVMRGTESSARSVSHPNYSIAEEAPRFSWERFIHPIPREECVAPERYRCAVLSFMELDHARARQNNVDNPHKAAADGVWRDLRQVLAYAIDFGGLTAQSHRDFLTVYMRHHNRLANGASLEVMQKILALIRCGLVDVSIGPHATVSPSHSTGRFVVRGPLTGAKRCLDTLIDAKVHPFDPTQDHSPLYRNLLANGLIRKWTNPGGMGPDFEPGGLELNADFHPIRINGAVEPRLTFLGPPSEGVMFFQLGALRPQQNHHVMRDIVRWLWQLWRDVTKAPAVAART